MPMMMMMHMSRDITTPGSVTGSAMPSPRLRRLQESMDFGSVGTSVEFKESSAENAASAAAAVAVPPLVAAKAESFEHPQEHLHHRFQGGSDMNITAAMMRAQVIENEEKTAAAAAAAAGAGTGSGRRRPPRQGRRAEVKPQPPAPTAPATPAEVPALASSFMRLTAALSSASLALDKPGALLEQSTLPSASASSAALTAPAALGSGVNAPSPATAQPPVSSADADALTTLLQRQTRLAKLKQSYTLLAAEESAERAAEAAQRQVHRVRPRMQMHLLRGESAAFSNQMTPVINPVERSIHSHSYAAASASASAPSSSRDAHAHSGGRGYDASHLGHSRLRDSAAQAASVLDHGAFDAEAFEAPLAAAGGSGGGTERSAGRGSGANANARMPLSESSFRSQRFIYARLNYLPLDRVQGYSEPVVQQKFASRRR